MLYSEAYQNYYALLKSAYLDETLGQDKALTLDQLTESNQTLVSTFTDMVDRLAQYESMKEEKYLHAWLDKLNTCQYQGTTLGQIVAPYIENTSQRNFSKAFELIELWRLGFVRNIKSFEEGVTQWKEEFQQFSNEFIKKTMEEGLEELYNADRLFDLTPQQLIEALIQKVDDSWEQRFGRSLNKDAFGKFLPVFEKDLEAIVAEMKPIRGKTPELSAHNFVNKKLSTLFKIKSPKELNVTLKAKIIDGLVNGLPQESFITLFGEGASTARASNKLKYFTSSKVQLVPTETDVYAVLTSNLSVNEAAIEDIRNLTTNEAIENRIAQVDVAHNFVLHYSSKDLTIAESGSSSVTAKVKGEGSLDAKIPALEEMGRAAGQEAAVHELIFEAINSGKDLIYGDNTTVIQRVSDSLTALAFTFMFDDFERQFEYMQNKIVEPPNTELNLYLISGNFFAASDLLRFLSQFVQRTLKDSGGKLVSSLVNVGFKPTQTNFYEVNSNSGLTGVALWEKVRNDVISDTKMQVRLSTNVLKRLAYAIEEQGAKL